MMFNLTRRALLSLLPSLPFVSMFVKAPRPEPLTDLDIPFDIDTYALPGPLAWSSVGSIEQQYFPVHKIELKHGVKLCYACLGPSEGLGAPCWLEGTEDVDYPARDVGFESSNDRSLSHYYARPGLVVFHILDSETREIEGGFYWSCSSLDLTRFPTIVLKEEIPGLIIALAEYQEHLEDIKGGERGRDVQMLRRPYMVGEGD